MYRCYLFLISALLVGQSGYGQSYANDNVRFGAGVDLNMSSMYIRPLQSGVTTSFIPGGRYGIMLDIPLTPNLFLQPGFFINWLGGKLSGSVQTNSGTANEADTWEIVYQQLPIDVFYKKDAGNSGRFYFGGGLYFNFHRETYVRMKLTQGSYSRDSTAFLDVLMKKDIGVQLAGGYEFNNGIFFRLGADVGFTNISEAKSQTCTNYCGRIGLGYFIGRSGGRDGWREKDRSPRYKRRK